jgi:beta-1,2-mannosidase
MMGGFATYQSSGSGARDIAGRPVNLQLRAVAGTKSGGEFRDDPRLLQTALPQATSALQPTSWSFTLNRGMKKNLVIFSIAIFLTGPVVAQVPPWGLGPFIRPARANPIIGPDTHFIFDCPASGEPVRWEALHTFNPAAVVKDGKVYVLYRAEDATGSSAIGSHTSRLGLAVSEDGLHFKCLPKPVLFPANDGQKGHEWSGGCEDPRLVESEDGAFVVTYTQWNRQVTRLAVATSKDLIHWTKFGPVFPNYTGFYKSGAIVCKISDGRLKAVKIHGKYWMYWGEGTVSCASSDDLIHWDMGKPALKPRPGKFDSALVEAGPPAVWTDKGIVVLYNGKNDSAAGDPALSPGIYSDGQALFDPEDPTHLLARTDTPFFKPETPYERAGQYAAGTTFIEGLVFFQGRWFLYYGCADSFVAVAVWNPAIHQSFPQSMPDAAKPQNPIHVSSSLPRCRQFFLEIDNFLYLN